MRIGLYVNEHYTHFLSSIKMVINIDNFKADLSAKFIKLMESERGTQAKLAKSIGKKTSYFSEIKRGNPVNSFHLKAVGIVFGSEKVLELLGLNNFGESQAEEDAKGIKDSKPILDRRILRQNQREGVISNFEDKETARQTILALAEIENLDRDRFMLLAGEIRGTARTLKPKKKA